MFAKFLNVENTFIMGQKYNDCVTELSCCILLKYNYQKNWNKKIISTKKGITKYIKQINEAKKLNLIRFESLR